MELDNGNAQRKAFHLHGHFVKSQKWRIMDRILDHQTLDQTLVQTRTKTQMEHLGAPWSTKCPFKTNLPSFYVCLKNKGV